MAAPGPQWLREPSGQLYYVSQDGRRITWDQWQAAVAQHQQRLAQTATGPRTVPTDPNYSAEQLARQRASSSTQPNYQAGPQASPQAGSSSQARVPLESTYRKKKVHWYQRYKVLKIYWHENAGEDVITVKSMITRDSTHGEPIFSKIRRLIILGTTKTHCICVPIQSYRLKGISKPGVDPTRHAIVFSKKDDPGPSKQEKAVLAHNRVAMKQSIRVVPDQLTEMLDPMSRINYSELYTVQYRAKVKPMGSIHPHYRTYFDRDSWQVLGPILFPGLTGQWTREALVSLASLGAALPSASSSRRQDRALPSNRNDADDDDDDDDEESSSEEKSSEED